MTCVLIREISIRRDFFLNEKHSCSVYIRWEMQSLEKPWPHCDIHYILGGEVKPPDGALTLVVEMGGRWMAGCDEVDPGELHLRTGYNQMEVNGGGGGLQQFCKLHWQPTTAERRADWKFDSNFMISWLNAGIGWLVNWWRSGERERENYEWMSVKIVILIEPGVFLPVNVGVSKKSLICVSEATIRCTWTALYKNKGIPGEEWEGKKKKHREQEKSTYLVIRCKMCIHRKSAFDSERQAFLPVLFCLHERNLLRLSFCFPLVLTLNPAGSSSC